MEKRPDGVNCTIEDYAAPMVYQHKILSQAAEPLAVPPWFMPAVQAALAPIRTDIKRLQNRDLLDGEVVPFEIVPFPDGSIPTQAPHELPALAVVDALTGPQINAYLNGYDVVPPVGANNLAANRLRKQALKIAIACEQASDKPCIFV